MNALPAQILDERVIPVARGLDGHAAPRLAKALRQGGLSIIEVTVERESGFEALEALKGGTSLVGAGSVTTIEQARRAIDGGAEFVVSPHLDHDLIAWATDAAVSYLPGVFTPSEAAAAIAAGATAVKLFPASVGGPELVKALLGPFPDLVVVPTGGVDAGNASSFLQAGAAAIGVGGWLTSHSDPEKVTIRSRELVTAIGVV